MRSDNPFVWAVRGLRSLDMGLRRGVVFLIGLWQRFVSPLYRVCRFEPSCSEYGRQAFERYPLPKAFVLTVGRVLRCHPFHPGGHDPLP